MRRRQRGYTLLEVVVAFAILTLSLGALFESFSMTLRYSGKDISRSRAVLVAASVRDRLGVDISLSAGDSSGGDGDCRWTVNPKPVGRRREDSAPGIPAFDVAIDVRCGEAGAQAGVHLDTVELDHPA